MGLYFVFSPNRYSPLAVFCLKLIFGGKEMTKIATDYEDVSQYPLDPEREKELIKLQRECTFMWANK